MYGRARRIKVKVKADKVNIWLPGIPLSIAIWILRMTKPFTKFFAKEHSAEAKQGIDLSIQMIKDIKKLPPFTLCNVESSDGTKVKIDLLP